ncbi:MAG: alpha/beta hydrolase, partial [Aliivibrio sp.]|nr:alpha/beta hydrolase [Aliivibrio sp.]
FTREAKKLCQKEFKRWFKLAADVNPLMRYFKDKELAIPTLYVMGANDYLFMKPVEEMVDIHEHSQLLQIPECGHVCNIDKPKEFNKHAIEFIAAQ